MQVICSDPVEGLHIICEDFTRHVTHSVLGNGEAGPSFGRVKYVAYNSRRDWIAVYADADSSGNVIVLLDDLSRELNRQQTLQLRAT